MKIGSHKNMRIFVYPKVHSGSGSYDPISPESFSYKLILNGKRWLNWTGMQV